MVTTEEWLGLVLSEEDHSCNRCKRPIKANTLGVAHEDEGTLHVRCASSLGWVASDSEAWTLALYWAAPEGVAQ
jgi:hypothetical protein